MRVMSFQPVRRETLRQTLKRKKSATATMAQSAQRGASMYSRPSLSHSDHLPVTTMVR